ncbi:MAG: hypothetical protein RKP20_17395 [Candidatus Competibacter sp.]|nr:hypothetical protein [Candidatus Competibacter sp.]
MKRSNAINRFVPRLKIGVMSTLLWIIVGGLSSHEANAGFDELIKPYIKRLLNREYKLSHTFKLTQDSSNEDVASALEQLNNDFTETTSESGALGLILKFSPHTGVIKLDWKRYTAAGVYTYPVYRCELMWDGYGWFQSCGWSQESCQYSAEADYTIYRTVNGQKIKLEIITNGSLSLSSWVRQFIKDEKRIIYYDDVNDLVGQTKEISYEVYADIRKYTARCYDRFDNYASSNSITVWARYFWLPTTLNLILDD